MEKSSAVEIYFETSARCACTFPTFNLAFNLNFLSSRKLRLKARLKVRAETLRLRPKAAVEIYFGTSARRACLFSRCICISLWEDMVSSLQCGGHKLMALRGDMIAVGVPNFAQ